MFMWLGWAIFYGSVLILILTVVEWTFFNQRPDTQLEVG